jgi:phosphoenolpyruvate---glycerone phosphotransferase subunit DhaK
VSAVPGTLKKLVNDPADVAVELVAAFACAHPDVVRQVAERVLVRADQTADKVGIATGGGSGHEPAFLGYVGAGGADAVAVGNIFTSPSPDAILTSIQHADRGRGVLLVYGNYSGDVMNCRLAVRQAAAAGIEVRQLFVSDDLASAPADEPERRRGIAGDVMVLKMAGAAAEAGLSLDEVEAAARAANDRTRTIGIALSSAELPGAAQPIFTTPGDRMEVGLGVHGEPGISTEKLGTADEVGTLLARRLLADIACPAGSTVALLVNGLGATPLLEQYLVHQAVLRELTGNGISVHRSMVGEFVTSLQMAGLSATITVLDDRLRELLDAPIRTVALWR